MNPQELAAKVGEVIGTSEWAEMSQERINQFAEATGDHQFIHVNEEMAKMTPFGGTIAHGFLTLSMIPYLGAQGGAPRIDGVKMGVNYGGNNITVVVQARVIGTGTGERTVVQRQGLLPRTQGVQGPTNRHVVQRGEPQAQEVAELNHASIISLTLIENVDQSVITAIVVVELDGVQAQATASNGP